MAPVVPRGRVAAEGAVAQSAQVQAEDPETTLCRACGICCSGVLFSHAEVEEHELPRLARRGLPVIRPEVGLPELNLPCAAHGPAGCSIYEDRPEKCASYACKLRGRLARGAVTLEAALATVARIKELARSVDAALPPGEWLWSRAATLRHAGAPPALEERRRVAGTLMDMKVLQLLLCRELDDRLAGDRETGRAPRSEPEHGGAPGSAQPST
jgi:Fe-S-cluster containining protein